MAAQKARISNSVPIAWLDGSPFNGYALALMLFPSINGITWDYAVLEDTLQRLRVPSASKLIIRNGYFEPDSYLWRTSSLNPPNVRYTFFYYDHADRLIKVNGNILDIDSAEADIAEATDITPTASARLTAPEQVPNVVPTVETPTGIMNGLNTSFFLSRVPVSTVKILRNGGFLVPGVDYSFSGSLLTMTSAPAATDLFKAFIW